MFGWFVFINWKEILSDWVKKVLKYYFYIINIYRLRNIILICIIFIFLVYVMLEYDVVFRIFVYCVYKLEYILEVLNLM